MSGFDGSTIPSASFRRPLPYVNRGGGPSHRMEGRWRGTTSPGLLTSPDGDTNIMGLLAVLDGLQERGTEAEGLFVDRNIPGEASPSAVSIRRSGNGRSCCSCNGRRLSEIFSAPPESIRGSLKRSRQRLYCSIGSENSSVSATALGDGLRPSLILFFSSTRCLSSFTSSTLA